MTNHKCVFIPNPLLRQPMTSKCTWFVDNRIRYIKSFQVKKLTTHSSPLLHQARALLPTKAAATRDNGLANKTRIGGMALLLAVVRKLR